MKKVLFFAICVMAVVLVGCEPNNPDVLGPNEPTNDSVPQNINKIHTGIVSSICTESAILHGSINFAINSYLSVRVGVIISEDSIELSNHKGNKIQANALIGKDFEVKVNNLTPKTKYYYNVWVFLNQTQYEFGQIRSFTTEALPDSGFENNYEWIELGLSVKWATCNIGADQPEEYGKYFAWGEVNYKNRFDLDNYKFYNGHVFYKYDKSLATLDLEDDAAHVNWGGNWRMPTKKEFEELVSNCTWEWVTLNEVTGYRITSNIRNYTNNSIFLPSAGYKLYSSTDCAGENGYYWSNTLEDYDYFAGQVAWQFISTLEFTSSSYGLNTELRVLGLPIRPVCP